MDRFGVFCDGLGYFHGPVNYSASDSELIHLHSNSCNISAKMKTNGASYIFSVHETGYPAQLPEVILL